MSAQVTNSLVTEAAEVVQALSHSTEIINGDVINSTIFQVNREQPKGT